MIRSFFAGMGIASLLVFGAVIGGFHVLPARGDQLSPEYVGPRALVASRDGRLLYVACEDARQVVWLQTADARVIRRVDLPSEPTGLTLTPDSTRLVVTCAAPQSSVVVLDAATGQTRQVLTAGHTAMSPVVSPDGHWLYVCNRFDNDVSMFDLGTGELVARIPAEREPVVAALTPDGRTLLAANHLPNTRTDHAFQGNVSPLVTVIETGSLAASAIELPHGANSIRGMSISPDGQYALVTHVLSNFESIPFRVDTGWINVNVVSVIDLSQRTRIATIGLDDYYRGAGNPWDVLWSTDGTMLYVSLAGTHELAMISTEDFFSDSIASVGFPPAGEPVVETIPLGDPPVLTELRRGQLLFEDATLCYQHWQSCASCHPDGRVDGLNWDLLNDGPGNPKNTKSMLLSHVTPPSMSLGVRATAEIAVRAGFVHILFSEPPEEDSAAIDAYLKSLQPVPSPYLVDGRLSDLAQRGRELFHSDRVACDRCHPAPLYTDLRAYDVGTRTPFDRIAHFDTPTLVEVWRTAPYLHDGRYTTIRDLLIDGRHGLRPSQKLTDEEIDALVEFVLSL